MSQPIIYYPINDCYTCVQGEGAQTGVAMVLLRLHGCAVGCPWCDTKETWLMDPAHEVTTLAEALGANPRYTYMTAVDIANRILRHHPGPKWVLVTGGEPAQYDLVPLVAALHEAGLRVAIETSGTETGHLEAGFDWVCVSPKLNMPGGKQVRLETLTQADEIKHVVGRSRDIEDLDELLATAQPPASTQICLQPVSTSPKATELCLETVMARGWRLSVQVHKYIGVK
jgi:7-carboxy-7-deazaguanine synthase